MRTVFVIKHSLLTSPNCVARQLMKMKLASAMYL